MARKKAAAKKKPEPAPKMVRLSISVEEAKLVVARKALGLKRNTDVVRFAFEHLLSHFEEHGEEE